MEEKQEIKKTELSWHTPVLGGDCPYCEEWNDYQDQNENDGGDGWHFPPCESKDEEECKSVTFKCKNPECGKEFGVEGISW